jgi:hypothetical protein
METKIKKRLSTGAIALVFAIILFFLIKMLYGRQWFSSITFSTEIIPLDIFNMLFSGAIAVWLGWYITKKLTEQRFLKEFIIKDISRIEEQIESFEKITQSNKLQLQVAFDELHNLQNKIGRLERAIKLTDFSCKNIAVLNTYQRRLFELATAESRVSPPKNEIQKICDDFVILLREIIYEINNR